MRKERFGIVDEEEVLRKRALRFNLPEQNQKLMKGRGSRKYKKGIFRKNIKKIQNKKQFRDRRGPKRLRLNRKKFSNNF